MRIQNQSGLFQQMPPVQKGQASIKMEKGTKVRATIVDIQDGQATIKLANGQLLKASLQTDQPIAKGDVLELVVTGQQDGQVVMSLSSDMEDIKQLSSMLDSLGMGGSEERRTELAREIQRADMPVTRETMENLREILHEYPDMDVREAVFLAKNSISPTDRNLEALRDLLSGGVGKDLAELAREIALAQGMPEGEDPIRYLLDKVLPNIAEGMLPEGPQEGPSNALLGALDAFIAKEQPEIALLLREDGGMRELADALLGLGDKPLHEANQEITNFVRGLPDTLSGEQKETLITLLREMNSMLAAETKAAEQPRPAQTAPQPDAAQAAQPQGDRAQSAAQLQQTLQQYTQLADRPEMTLEMPMTPSDAPGQPNTAEAQPLPAQVPEGAAQPQPQPGEAPQAPVDAQGNPQPPVQGETAQPQQPGMPSVPMEAGGPPVTAQPMPEAAQQPAQTMETPQQAATQPQADIPAQPGQAQQSAQPPVAGQAQPAAQPPVEQVVQQPNAPATAQTPPSGAPDEATAQTGGAQSTFPALRKEEIDLLRAFSRVFARLGESEALAPSVRRAVEETPRSVSEMFHAMEHGGKQAPAPLSELRAQVDIMKNISDFHYAQFPLLIGERQAQTELYVMKREGGGKRIDPENTTMVVALETENIGRVESIMKVVGRNLSIRMRCLENIVPYMKAHSVEMYGLMREAGYKMVDMNVSSLQEPITPLNVEEQIMEQIGADTSPSVLDLRA